MPHGDIPAINCAGCGIPLATDETYACVRCCAGWMQDDNIRMHGGGDEKSQTKM
ncbi:protein NinF [Pantoea agglomerans]|uniref:protein NinF n=1 Tax=Enterobacter agglomerans TaxID=549 RepID=UPI003C7BFC28